MTTAPSSLQWLRPPGFRYDPTVQTPAQQAREARYQRATTELKSQPPVQGVDPKRAGQTLIQLGSQLADEQLRVTQQGGQITNNLRRGLNDVEGDARERMEGLQRATYRANTDTYVDGRTRLEDSAWGRAARTAEIMRGMSADMGAQVAGAVSGEQANDRMKLEILREALKPTLVDNIAGLAGAIAPIAALFVS